MTDIFTDFLEGCAQVLIDASVAVYRPAGPAYSLTEVGIQLGSMPDGPTVPDTMIALYAYQPGGDDPNLPMGRLALQAKTRGTTDPRVENGIRGGIYQALQGLRHQAMGSVHVVQMRNISSASAGIDAKGRTGTYLTFYAAVDLPATANRNLAS